MVATQACKDCTRDYAPRLSAPLITSACGAEPTHRLDQWAELSQLPEGRLTQWQKRSVRASLDEAVEKQQLDQPGTSFSTKQC